MADQSLSCSVCDARPERVLGEALAGKLDRVDARVVAWLSEHSARLLRMSLGVVFYWFGALKFFPGLSPAQDLATRTIDVLSFGLVPPSVSIFALGALECLIGIGLLSGFFQRLTLLLLLAQMSGTVTPVFLFPAEVFSRVPYAPTLEGQYIIKNLVLISAALVLGSRVRRSAERSKRRRTGEGTAPPVASKMTYDLLDRGFSGNTPGTASPAALQDRVAALREQLAGVGDGGSGS